MGGFRFWRRVSIIPGVRLNLSKSGVSVSVGKRGANLTLGGKGPRITVGLPGTGLSYTENFKGKSDRHEHAEMPDASSPSTSYRSRDTLRSENFTFSDLSDCGRTKAEAQTTSPSEEEEKPSGCVIFITAVLIIISYLWWRGWFD